MFSPIFLFQQDYTKSTEPIFDDFNGGMGKSLVRAHSIFGQIWPLNCEFESFPPKSGVLFDIALGATLRSASALLVYFVLKCNPKPAQTEALGNASSL